MNAALTEHLDGIRTPYIESFLMPTYLLPTRACVCGSHTQGLRLSLSTLNGENKDVSVSYVRLLLDCTDPGGGGAVWYTIVI